MIRIRYKDFSAGTHDATWLHGKTERDARGVTVYLVPGLTARQRRAVIRRLRQEASRGFGPALPLPGLVTALARDRMGTGARIAGTVIRLHPAVTLVPGALVAALMALFVLASAGGAGLTGGLARSAAAADGGLRLTGTGLSAVRTPQTAGVGGTGLGSGTRSSVKTGERKLVYRGGAQEVRPGPACGRSFAWYVSPRRTVDRPGPGPTGFGPVQGGIRVGHHSR